MELWDEVDNDIIGPLIDVLGPDADMEDLKAMAETFKTWKETQRSELFSMFASWFAPTQNGGSPDFATNPQAYLKGMQTLLTKDLGFLQEGWICKGLLKIEKNPLLKFQWNEYLRKEKLAPAEFWDTVLKVERAEEAQPVALLTAKDFLLEDDEDIDWLVDGLVAKGTLILLAGPPKAGKSTFARHLLMSVLTGTSFLGREVQEGKVLLYSLEDPYKVSGKHFRDLGLLPSMLLWGRLTHENGPFLDTLREDVSQVEPALIIVDTMNVALDWEDMNNMVETTDKLTPFRALTRSTDATIILLAHTRKTSTGSALDILGSTGLRAASDVNMVYHHDEETDIRYLHTEGKLGTHFKHTPIALDHGRCTLGKYSHLSPIDSAMLQVLTVEPGSTMSHTQWLKACKVGTREKRAEAITRLQREGLVMSRRGEKNAMHYTVFSPDMG